MCGITGIFRFDGLNVDLHQLRTMCDSISHRGPDGEGQWISANGKIGLGHRRLSIIDLSPAAAQPMHYLEERYTITFNGEIYNYLELKAQLRSKGYVFKTASDTEVLLALYDHKKEKCLDDLDGMFAFVIHDNVENSLFCARDRFGEKPFYFSIQDKVLLFGSEMKALMAGGVKPVLSHKRLHYFLAFNLYQDPADQGSTFYENIRQLPPAHYMNVSANGKITGKKYWQLDLKKEIRITEMDAQERFLELFTGSLSRRLRSDVPVGSSLSGGLDSSAIVLLIDKMKATGQKQKTFSARFRDFSKDEGSYMEMVGKKAGSVELNFIWPDEELLISEFDKICHHQEEPFGSTSIVAQWAVMKLAKEHNVTVLLDGQGADELLAGYRPFFTPFLNSLLAKSSPEYERERQALKNIQGFDFSPGIRTRTMLKQPGVFNVLSKTSHLLIARKKKKYSNPAYHEDLSARVNDLHLPFEGELNDDLRTAQQRVLGRAGFSPLLRYADRSSMAFSRELRLPFLDKEFAEFCFAIPDQLKIHDGWTKFIQRKVFENILPEQICWRKDKVGFETPQEKWMNHPDMQGRIKDSAALLRKEKIVNGKPGISDWKLLMAAKLFEKK